MMLIIVIGLIIIGVNVSVDSESESFILFELICKIKRLENSWFEF